MKVGLVTTQGAPVPLKDIHVDVAVSGFVARVESHLHYTNDEEAAIEATFTFPLDDGAAVFRFEADIDGRHIVAECQEKQQARQTYDDAIASGQTAMLLEEDDRTGDIFCCTLGNLPPKSDAKLTLSYVIELPQEHDGKLRFTLPTVLNPRYSPDAGSVVAAKGATYAPTNAIPYQLTAEAIVMGKLRIQTVSSVTDKLVVDYSPDRYVAQIKAVDGFTFDHDLAFLIEYEDPYKPQVILEKGNTETSGFLKQDVLMVNFFPNISEAGQTNCGEYIFVIDRSGSMGFGSNKMGNAKEALLLFLTSLPVGCYFNVVSFGSSFTSLFSGGSQEYSKSTLDQALRLQREMDADMGGTEILRPLQDIYSKSVIRGHPRQIFLLTDGEVGNVDDVIGLVKKNAPRARVFAVGIGAGASTSLVQGVARVGKGKAEFIADSGRIQPKVMSLLKCAMQPSITSLDVDWSLPPGVAAVTMPPVPPSLFGGERLIIYAMLQGTNTDVKKQCSVTITGETDKGKIKEGLTFDLGSSDPPDSQSPLHRLAAKAHIKELQDKEDEHRYGDAGKATKEQIIVLSTSSNMASRHTSFVAVDKESRDRVGELPVHRSVPSPSHYYGGMQKASCCTGSAGSVDSRQNVGSDPFSTQRPWFTERGDGGERRMKCSFQGSPSEPAQSGSMAYSGAGRGGRHPGSLMMCDADDADDADDDEIISGADTMSSAVTKSSRRIEAIDQGVDSIKDSMMSMVGLQNFEGNWELTTEVCRLMSLDIDKVRANCFLKDTSLVVTLLVLDWLAKQFPHRKDEWEMIETKAIGWIKPRDLEGRSLDGCVAEVARLCGLAHV